MRRVSSENSSKDESEFEPDIEMLAEILTVFDSMVTVVRYLREKGYTNDQLEAMGFEKSVEAARMEYAIEFSE